MTLQRQPAKAIRHPSKQAVYATVDRRDGDRCVMCNALAPKGGREHSHRAHAGMGGSPRSVRPANLLLSCGPFGCNYRLSHDADFAELGRRNGWLLDRDADPESVPVLYHGAWVLLDDHGDIRDAAGITDPQPEGPTMHTATDPTEPLPPIPAEDGATPVDEAPQSSQIDPLGMALQLLAEATNTILQFRKGTNARDKIALAQALATATLAGAQREANQIAAARLQQVEQFGAKVEPAGRIVIPHIAAKR